MKHTTNRRNIVSPTVRPDNTRISVVIPAAGFGSRMKSHGPKSLVKIKNDLTIIENQLKYIYRYLNRPQIVLVAGFEAPKVKAALEHRRNVLVVDNPRWESTNVVKSIGIGLQHTIYPNILVIYGDLVFNAWTLKVPLGPSSMVLTDRYGLMKDEEVGCIVQNNMLENMMYSLPNKWAQIAYFTGKEQEMLKHECAKESHSSYFGFEIVNIIINSGGKFIAHSHPRMKITDIDSSKDLALVREII